ncbi:hypothetical protein [Streptomyces sp. A1547]|uniref:hypothetical protein n=1 Tax=Streptomyces sp. A1547 TaxID=2563105 RepID=UPI00109E9202|nr:hypothetical protein [Streptomyces sp. A1547]THA30554.1 hypothetical protein E6W17_37665 [Streptomyces sp. A1547]
MSRRGVRVRAGVALVTMLMVSVTACQDGLSSAGRSGGGSSGSSADRSPGGSSGGSPSPQGNGRGTKSKTPSAPAHKNPGALPGKTPDKQDLKAKPPQPPAGGEQVKPFEEGLKGRLFTSGSLRPGKPKNNGDEFLNCGTLNPGGGFYVLPEGERASFKAYAVLAEFAYPEQKPEYGTLPTRTNQKNAPGVVVTPASGTIETGGKVAIRLSGTFWLGHKKFYLIVENATLSSRLSVGYICIT